MSPNNLANLLTKRHNIKVDQVSIGSTWQKGEPWMRVLRVLNIVLKFRNVLKHETFHEYLVQNCTVCTSKENPDPRPNHQESKDILFRFESKRVGASLSPKE